MHYIRGKVKVHGGKASGLWGLMVLGDFLEKIPFLILTLGQLIGRVVLFNGVFLLPHKGFCGN